MDKSENEEIKKMIDFGDGGDDDAIEETRSINIPEMIEKKKDDGAANSKTDFSVEEPSDEYDAEEEYEDGDYEDAEYDDEDYDNEYITARDEDTEEEPPPKKRASRKAKIIRRCVIAAVIIAAVIAFAVIDTGIIGEYKTNFANNFSRIFGITINSSTEDETTGEESEGVIDTYEEYEEYMEENSEEYNAEPVEAAEEEEKIDEDAVKYNTEKKLSVIIPYEYANTAEYAKYKGGVVCAAINHLQYINSKGNVEWECATSVVNPILVTAGKYILIAQEGGTKICLYEGSKLIYDTDTENNILTADVSSNGDCVFVTDRDMYKGCIEAYNKRGECIYMWSSGDMSVTDASISPSSRNIAAVMIAADSKVYSAVRVFDIEKEGIKSEVTFDDTLLFDVKYFKDTVNAFGDNAIYGISSNGKSVFNITFENTPIMHYSYDEDGNKLVCAELNNIPTLILFNAGGSQKSSTAADDIPSFLQVDGTRAMYNNGRDTILGKLDAAKLSKYTAGKDIKDLIMVDSDRFFVVYSNSLQLIRM